MWMVNPNHQLVDGQNQTYNGLDLGVDQLTRNLGAALCMVYGEYDYSSWGYVLQMVPFRTNRVPGLAYHGISFIII